MFSPRQLKKLIIPLIIEQALAISVGMADTVMVSSLGDAVMSGVSLVDNINTLVINIFAAFGTGGAVVASQFIGARRPAHARATAAQVIVSTLLVSLAVTGICLALREQIISLLFGEIEQAVMSSASEYFFVSALSYPAIGVYSCCSALFRAMGNSKYSMYSSATANVINVIGNAIFIYALGEGAKGAAIASLIARMFAMAAMLWLLTDRKNVIYISFKEKFAFNMNMIKRIFRIGLPSSLENGIFQLGRIIVLRIIAVFGTVQIAANGVANSLSSLGCIPGQAMNLALITVVGTCVGAGDLVQVKYYTKKLMKLTYLFTAVVNSAIILSLPLTLRLYDLSDEAISLAFVLTVIHDGFAMLLWPSAFTLSNALRAANDVRYTMIVSVSSMIVFRVGLSLVFALGLGYGAIGVFAAMVVDWVFRTVLFVVRYRREKWWWRYCSA
ncbi:MAG: MATE family efflux transporter [Clostridiales bacterium]|nr:MAG: MATE family efflux transporter [Clostridiales bacterium]